MSNRGVAMNVSVSRSRVIEDLLNRLYNKENPSKYVLKKALHP